MADRTMGDEGLVLRRVRIRRFKEGDAGVYADLLMTTSEKEYSALSRQEIRAMVDLMDKDWVWVAVLEGEAVGFVTAVPDGVGLHVIWFDVWPDHQGKGIGSLLMDKVLEVARRHDFGILICEVWDGNEGAIRFYERHGFSKVRWIENYYSNGLSAWQMVRPITGKG